MNSTLYSTLMAATISLRLVNSKHITPRPTLQKNI